MWGNFAHLGHLLSLACFLFFTNTHVTAMDKLHQDLRTKLFTNYEKGIRPNVGAEPVRVEVSMYVLALTEINQLDMTFTTNLYFRQKWNDNRLKFDHLNITGIDSFTLSGDDINKIWEPDTFVVNEVNSFQHQTFVPNSFVRISSNGLVLKSQRYTVAAMCPMDLSYFPFDQQLCNLEFESYGFTMSDVRYTWFGRSERDSVGIASDVSLPEFRVIGHRSRKFEVALTTGNYSRLAVEILVERSHGSYLSRFFMPLCLFVFISLLSLWLASDKVAVVINFISICVINIIMAEESSDLPRISYSTRLDVYFTLCVFHVIFCLIDSLVANYFATPIRTNQALEMTPQQRRESIGTDDVETLVNTRNHPATEQRSLKKRIGQLFDLVNLFVKAGLLVSFILGNIIFFSVSNSGGKRSLDDFVPVMF